MSKFITMLKHNISWDFISCPKLFCAYFIFFRFWQGIRCRFKPVLWIQIILHRVRFSKFWAQISKLIQDFYSKIISYKSRILPYYTFLTKQNSSFIKINYDLLMILVDVLLSKDPETYFYGSWSGCSKSPGSATLLKTVHSDKKNTLQILKIFYIFCFSICW